MVTVESRSKSLRSCELQLDGKTSLDDVLVQISKQNKGISKHRLRLTYLKENKQVPIIEDAFFSKDDGASISGMTLYVKDLGPQISWRLVFFIEYLGPILIHSALYYLSTKSAARERFHSRRPYDPFLNQVAYILVMGHYFKREFETLFVHQFSLATMPLFNVFKNSFHYWILNGAISFGYFGYGFLLSNERVYEVLDTLRLTKLSTLIALFALAETWNFYIHVRLRVWGDQQKALGNAKKRVPINDGVFKALVAPNYTFEVWAWIFFTVIFKFNFFGVLFLTVSTTQMYLWAQKKNKKYGTRRAFLIPYIV
ncbi:trans-2-enoyl-CoA reductase (NADPH) TSC13 KNAG_0K01650 [Huiozyma naganishii CBS 8797]|uniref:3-oxo-5-alpha-steroid 4-dehydrogenase C-terminal domain-containing protein n=1 Tax=Huiozyma naganishii (strain ATCC MYA-139 / BCRC 22969 / CBS 8797 / KCTC 17520 / NBRC 10181 / NCYC 3082 / Yp74L-3) TaxID=1071383 RepID=J7RRQ2_HUIN7|nr:hypothetical protein KNAG_0K01650 [Kazachstania naganishii CBS 8797]CCK72528.1 hypothetical protein KNAG_0K01650 [Kazachstania naganishii CBS 8797]